MRALLLQRLRQDRVTVSIWVASTAFLALVSSIGVAREFDTAADRSGILRLAVANPTILLLRGLPQGADLDQFIFFQIFTYLGLMAGLMTTFLVVRHTRAEEESGRAELISSTPAARLAPLVATVVHALLANLALGLLVAVAFVATGLDLPGSLLSGAAAAAVGVAFIGVALLAAQVLRSARAANSTSVTLVLAAFLLRGIGDALGTASSDGLRMTSAWPSWLSPIGWAQHVDAFGSNTAIPLLLHLGLAVVTVGAAFAIQSRRDLGASIVAPRAGRAFARRDLGSSLGLAWRLQWPSVVGWAIGGAACGLFAGSLSPLVKDAAAATPAIGDSLGAIAGTDANLDQALITVMFSIAGVLAAACAIQAVIRARQEESGGTAELVLTATVSRVRWLAGYLAVGAVAIVAVLASAAVVAHLAILATGSSADLVDDVYAAGLAQLPAALLFIGALALVFTVLPAFTAALGWGLLGGLFFLGVFGPLIGLPEGVTTLSPFANTPVLSGDDLQLDGGVWMLAAALVALAASIVLMRRRELRVG